MGHPDRRAQRLRKKQDRRKKEEMLGRRSYFDVLDLTPYNAVGLLKSYNFEIRFK